LCHDHEKLLAITHIKPLEASLVSTLEAKLDDLTISWAARSLHTGDPNIRAILDRSTSWSDGKDPAATRESVIAEAFYRPYGDRGDSQTTSLIDLTIFDPKQEQSKHKAYWAVGLDHLLEEGWRVCFTDGSSRESLVAGACYSGDRKGGGLRLYGAFGGPMCSVADG